MGLGGKLFALQWDILKYNARFGGYVVDIPEERLKNHPASTRIIRPTWQIRARASRSTTTTAQRQLGLTDLPAAGIVPSRPARSPTLSLRPSPIAMRPIFDMAF
jgi:hypothetical protein